MRGRRCPWRRGGRRRLKGTRPGPDYRRARKRRSRMQTSTALVPRSWIETFIGYSTIRTLRSITRWASWWPTMGHTSRPGPRSWRRSRILPRSSRVGLAPVFGSASRGYPLRIGALAFDSSLSQARQKTGPDLLALIILENSNTSAVRSILLAMSRPTCRTCRQNPRAAALRPCSRRRVFGRSACRKTNAIAEPCEMDHQPKPDTADHQRPLSPG